MPSLNTKLASAPNTQTNYVLKATSSTTIGNSLIQDNGTTITLGGALSGTSATFSSNITATDAVLTKNGDITIKFNPNNVAKWDLYYNNADGTIGFYDRVGSAFRMTLAQTGAATFSSTSGIGLTIQADWDRSATNNNQLYIRGNSNTNKQLRLGYDTTGNVGYIQALTSGTSVDNLLLNPSGGNVGIGTTSPNDKFVVDGGNNIWTGVLRGTTTASQSFGMQIFAGTNSSDTAFRILNGATTSTYMIVRGDGNVGIGTSSPSTPLHIQSSASGMFTINSTDANGGYMVFQKSGSARGYIGSAYHLVAPAGSSSDLAISNDAGNIVFITGASFTERMRITSGGQVVVNATSSIPNAYISAVANSNQPYPLGAKAIDSSQGLIGFFDGSNNIIGNVFRSNSSVQYNTSSDYRLKEDLKDLNGLDKVLSIKVYDFKWKNYESRTDGVMAHELAEILPYAVNGIKDAVDEDGNIIPQGVDYSKIVPVLVKAIQELNQNIQNQQQQINQLINK